MAISETINYDNQRKKNLQGAYELLRDVAPDIAGLIQDRITSLDNPPEKTREQLEDTSFETFFAQLKRFIHGAEFTPEEIEKFQNYLRFLRPREQKILEMRLRETPSFRVLGEAFGISQSHVRNIFLRARDKLRAIFLRTNK